MLYPIAEQWTYLQVTHPDRDFEPGPLLFVSSILPRPARTTPHRPCYLFPDEWCLIKFWVALKCVAGGFGLRWDICRSLEKIACFSELRKPKLGPGGFAHILWVLTVGGFSVWNLARSQFLNKLQNFKPLAAKGRKIEGAAQVWTWSGDRVESVSVAPAPSLVLMRGKHQEPS